MNSYGVLRLQHLFFLWSYALFGAQKRTAAPFLTVARLAVRCRHGWRLRCKAGDGADRRLRGCALRAWHPSLRDKIQPVLSRQASILGALRGSL